MENKPQISNEEFNDMNESYYRLTNECIGFLLEENIMKEGLKNDEYQLKFIEQHIKKDLNMYAVSAIKSVIKDRGDYISCNYYIHRIRNILNRFIVNKNNKDFYLGLSYDVYYFDLIKLFSILFYFGDDEDIKSVNDYIVGLAKKSTNVQEYIAENMILELESTTDYISIHDRSVIMTSILRMCLFRSN